MFIAALFTIARTRKHRNVHRHMDEGDVAYIYYGIIPIKRNEIVPFAEMWMD